MNRRTILAAAGAASLGLGLGVSPPAHARPQPRPKSRLNRPDRAFLANGLVHGAWVRSGSKDGWFPDNRLWKGAGFTTPTFYGEMIAASAEKKLEYSAQVMRGKGNAKWAMARAPQPGVLQDPSALPDPTADWMTPAMAAHTKSLFSICLGDEEAYSEALTDYLRQAIARLHQEYPDILVHTNQALGQYAGAELSDYVQSAKPDMITWDWYIWQRNQAYAGGSVTGLYNTIGRYRDVALAGLDGTGADPIAFGQYTVGFRLQPPPASPTDTDYKYKRRGYISQSQQNLVPYLTWAMGGKWLTMFRWELDEDYPPWETDGLFLTDAQERPLPAYGRYAEINHAMRAFSPYIVRLRSASVGRIAGLAADGTPTAVPSGIQPFSPSTDPDSGLRAITVTNIGTTNGGHPGDVVVGTFTELPQMSAAENAGVLPDRAGANAFMLVNAMAYGNVDWTDPYSTGGNGADCRQRIEVTVVPPTRHGVLYRVDERTGRAREVRLRRSAEGAVFTVDVDGGAGALYLWG